MKPSSLRFFIQDNNDVFGTQQRCLYTTTTMFWHATTMFFKDNRDNRDNSFYVVFVCTNNLKIVSIVSIVFKKSLLSLKKIRVIRVIRVQKKRCYH